MHGTYLILPSFLYIEEDEFMYSDYDFIHKQILYKYFSKLLLKFCGRIYKLQLLRNL